MLYKKEKYRKPLYRKKTFTRMEEPEHIVHVLEAVKKALIHENVGELNDLSNQTIHCATTVQDAGSITIAVLVYAVSKLIERKEKMKIKNWDLFVKKFISFLDLAMTAAREQNEQRYEEYLAQARKTFDSIALSIKPYIEEILRKASINKASKVYEHGISLGQTAHILGVSQWELTEYMGQTNAIENNYNTTVDIKKRAKTAMDFFS